MTQTQELARRRTTDPNPEAQAQAREPEFTLQPPADIYEDADGISILLDMAGVSRDRLNVKADRNALLVEGEAALSMPQELEATYAEVRSSRYRRSFTLTNELDVDQIEATMKDGVLTIRIPKRAELKPRRIEIRGSS